ncbi:ABC transporter substrate-binding protein [Nitriliruptor alkaliphilus]|uniref:ABC transporter substrate-binding protein n=1 Tax=Nitriliruptor alkaliphilus TaxID=427918 RepID=UPI0006964964|nr:sugar ABC transporter substrate-binding protein [Nitriliruptor alkaliphilus]
MRTKRALAAVIAAATVLTACGGNGDDGADDTDGTAATDDGAADDGSAGEGGEVALRWRTRPDNQAEIDVYQSVSDTIAADWDGVELEYEPGGTETASYQDALRTEIAGGTAPDVFWIPGTDIADFASRGLILDVRELAAASDAYAGDDAYYDGPMELLTYDPESGSAGQALWGLPRDVSTFGLYLNLDLIAEAGAPDPRELDAAGNWNWDTFREVGEAVSGLGDEIYGFGMNNWWANPGIWINSAGGNFFNADRTACAVDSDEAILGLEFMTGLYQDDLAVPYGEDSQPPFQAGQVAMQLTGRWSTPAYRTIEEFEWDVVNVPAGPAGAVNWTFWGAYVVNANTDHPEAAFELLTRLTDGEVQGQIAELGANIPSRTDDPDTIDTFLTYTPPANNQAFIDGLNSSVPEGPLWQGDWPAFDTILAPAIEGVVSGSQSLEDFQATICGQLDPTFD